MASRKLFSLGFLVMRAVLSREGVVIMGSCKTKTVGHEATHVGICVFAFRAQSKYRNFVYLDWTTGINPLY